MYTDRNFKTKKALREAVAAGDPVRVYQPNKMYGAPEPTQGWVTLEGPHFPEPHKWYARALLVDGKVTKVQ